MARYVCFREEDWKYLCDHINWGASNLDARSVRILNEPVYKFDDEEV